MWHSLCIRRALELHSLGIFSFHVFLFSLMYTSSAANASKQRLTYVSQDASHLALMMQGDKDGEYQKSKRLKKEPRMKMENPINPLSNMNPMLNSVHKSDGPLKCMYLPNDHDDDNA